MKVYGAVENMVVSVDNLPTDLLTDAQLRASPLPVMGGWLTDTQLRASPLLVSTGITGYALAAKQLPENHRVTVSKNEQLSGTWDYYAGIAGTVNVTGRVLQIAPTCGKFAGMITINGGELITIPPGKSITINPHANLVDPEITFTNTEAYFIEVLV